MEVDEETQCPYCSRVLRRDSDRRRHEPACRRRNRQPNTGSSHQDVIPRYEHTAPNQAFFQASRHPQTFGSGFDDYNLPIDSHSSEDNEPDDDYHPRNSSSSSSGEDSTGFDGEEVAEDDLNLNSHGMLSEINVPEVSTDDLVEDGHCSSVSYEQYKAAVFILTDGPSNKGMSMMSTDSYLKSLHRKGEVRQLWKNGSSFWKDHARRQRAKLPKIGKWSKQKLTRPTGQVSVIETLVRDLPTTIQHVVSSATLLRDGEKEINWNQHVRLEPFHEYNAQGQRILTEWHSADDTCYAINALKLRGNCSNLAFIPFQLFIDKANVTRLNKRSMYPVVLYLLCFSRKVRRALVVNVAFVPIISKYEQSTKMLSKDKRKLLQNAVLQGTLKLLLEPIQEDLKLNVELPDQQRRSATPFLLSIIADAPEVAVLMSSRYGISTNYPCQLCYVMNDNLWQLTPDDQNFKSSKAINMRYDAILKLPTARREHFLKALSLRLPKSTLLSRFELNLDQPETVQQLVHYKIPRPFGLHSLPKFEPLHNFDLGITADLLRAIEEYFSVMVTSRVATQVVNNTNRHQGLLPRKSQTGLFRLPQLGTTVAETHANVTAYQFSSALFVLPFMLNGAAQDNLEALRAMPPLLRFVMSYLKLHNYVRRVNSVPWFVYENVEEDILALNENF